MQAFSTLFPAYREKYLKEVWPALTKALKKLGIGCELNLVEGSMTVRTTKQTKDPYTIMKARDLIKLIARSIPFAQALKIMEDEVQCDIIKVGGLVRNKERFVKRRQRLLGPNGQTLKAIELLTGCYVLVQGNTVSAMGSFKGIKQVRKIVLDCMKNKHPVYNIKEMMIRRELAKDPKLATENWDRFLPKFKKSSAPKKAVAKSKKKQRVYTPFPPAQPMSKVDKQLESGEFFLNEAQRLEQKRAAKQEKSLDRKAKKDLERQAVFIEPVEKKEKGGREDLVSEARKAKRQRAGSVDNLVKKLKKRKKKSKKTEE